MKIFIDTNVILDFTLQREPFADEAEKIMKLAFHPRVQLFTSAVSITNVTYLARKAYRGLAIYNLLQDLRELLHVTSLDEDMVDAAINLKADDFEDAIQYFSASEAAIDCIVTRNAKDFPFSKIPVLTPREFIDHFMI